MVFDQCVNHKGVGVDVFASVGWLTCSRRLGEVASVIWIEEMFGQKLVSGIGCLQGLLAADVGNG